MRRSTLASRCLGLIALASLALVPATASASKAEWSMFEDPAALVQTDAATRERTLNEIKALGADTIRIEVKWADVAPHAFELPRPQFDDTNPDQYPGFGPYDDLVKRVTAKGFRVLMTITGDTPRWASADHALIDPLSANFRPDASQFAHFAGAVAARYSGRYAGIPKVPYFSIWNEPNHIFFIKPASEAGAIYRALVNAALPAIRANAAPGSQVFIGELAPVGRSGRAIGPKAFLRSWLCLDSRYRALAAAAARAAGCEGFKLIAADGFAHHAYGPPGPVPRTKDVLSVLQIRQLGSILDAAARAGRLPAHLPIYNTEFGYQSNPPDTTVKSPPRRQARLINEKEEASYRYSRLKSHSQYLLYDDPARPGPPAERWSGFQTGLRFAGGREKPAYDAYRLPIVVHASRHGVTIWGRVRPGSGVRYARLLRKRGASFVKSGPLIHTNSLGYFTAKRNQRSTYRFRGYLGPSKGASARSSLGLSRKAKPIH